MAADDFESEENHGVVSAFVAVSKISSRTGCLVLMADAKCR
jgi:hypothetical protein